MKAGPRRSGAILREQRHLVAVLRLLVLAGLVMLGVGVKPTHSFLYWFLTIVYGGTIFGYLWARNCDYELERVRWVIFLFDVGLVSALIVLRGSNSTEFLTAYFALILMAAIAEGLGNAVVNAALVSIAYAVLTRWGTPLEEILSFPVISQFVFFFIIAVFMGHLAQEARAHAADRDRVRAALQVTSGELRQSTEKLKEARDALRANDRLTTLGMLSAGIAHELKNPLTAIVSNLEPAAEIVDELQERLDPNARGSGALGELESIIGDCGVAADQLRRVARDLTSVARNGPIEIVPVDPTETIECAVRILRSRVANGMEIETRVTTTRLILSDPGRLLQVLLNLAGNALDAMELQGTGTLAIRAIDGGGDRVALVVADTGPGMSEEVRQQVFAPFFTTKPAGRGTGLGLHVVNEIVRAQSGTIQCETRLGEGTTFRVDLPAQPSGKAIRPSGKAMEIDHVGSREDTPDRGRRSQHPQGTAAHAATRTIQSAACV